MFRTKSGCPSQCILVKAQTVEALPLLSQPSSKHVAKASVRIAFQASKCHGPWSKIKWLEIRVPMLTAAPLQLEAAKLRQHQYHQGKCYPRKRDHPNWLTPIKNSEVLCLWLTCIAWAPNKKVADMCVKWLQYKHELNYCINSLITSASKDFFTLVLHFAAIQTWLLMTKVVLHSGKFTG